MLLVTDISFHKFNTNTQKRTKVNTVEVGFTNPQGTSQTIHKKQKSTKTGIKNINKQTLMWDVGIRRKGLQKQ